MLGPDGPRGLIIATVDECEVMKQLAGLWGGMASGVGSAGGLLNASLGMLRAAVPATQRDLVRLRLQRFGRRNLPFYRIVAADSRSPRDGRCIEYIGTYNPIPNKHGEKLVTLNFEVRSCPSHPSAHARKHCPQFSLTEVNLALFSLIETASHGTYRNSFPANWLI